MKSSPILLIAILFFLTSCGSGNAGQFEGTWQSLDDPSQQIVFNRSGKTITFATKNLESSVEGLPGTYNKKSHAVEFVDGNGDTTALVYNETTQHISGLGVEFTKAGAAAVENAEETNDAEETVSDEETSNTASAVDPKDTSSTASCAKGDILVITGNNVRLRNEPDVTKQNILMQVHKNFQVVRMADKTVDGQKWYKVCYDGNIGWVSGQYASAK